MDANPTKSQAQCMLTSSLPLCLRQWYIKFDKYIKFQGYVWSQEDHCLYIKRFNDGSLIILLLYIDDMLIAGKSKDEIALLKDALSKHFATKDLGNALHVLGMCIKRDRKRGILELSHEVYINKVLQRFNMQREKGLSTPMVAYVKRGKSDCLKSEAKKAYVHHG
ncbi:hypothetical protein L7F22_020777 [Adiantum nelumboides]|nr:hypothetical protein [Adiantum nelumboides]